MTKQLDVSLKAISQTWYNFRRGKRVTNEMLRFWYRLEIELLSLFHDLATRNYKHSSYHSFTVTDNKRREINVATIRDRVVHRLMYEYLVEHFDPIFIYDVWSCRKEKGLLRCIDRVQALFHQHRHCYLWRTDIKKFFDNINHDVLKGTIARKVVDSIALKILNTIINSYQIPSGGGR